MRYATLALLLCFAGCAAEDPESTGGVDGDEDSSYADESVDTASAPYRIEDPEQALAAIPSQMHPSVLMDELAVNLLVPDAITGGLALFSDVVQVDVGEDVTYCTYTDVILEEGMYIHDTLGQQTTGGHHAILQFLTTPQEVGTRACPDEDDLAAQFGQILGGTGGEGNGAIVLPKNVVSEVPAGAQLVINHHWINVTDGPIEAQAEMITVPAETDEDLVIARAMAVVHTQFDLPPGESTKTSMDCEFPEGATLLSMLGHMHQWGTHVRADRMGTDADVIFDHDYDPEMISQPLTVNFPIDAPFEFAPGDVARISCQWDNTESSSITFPREMCVLFGWQIGVDKDTTCLDGQWL